MIRHFFLDKTNSIIENTKQNIGLNPILHVCYGKKIIRGLIHFDINEIAKLIKDKTFANVEKLRFNLKMTNCFSVDGLPYEKELVRGIDGKTVRATSFDLMLFKLPCDFDMGRGFDLITDFWIKNTSSYSDGGSTWFNAKSAVKWNDGKVADSASTVSDGIYKKEFLSSEYEKYINGENSIVIGSQHFDFGDENLSIDITKYILDCIRNDHNYGLCLSFIPLYENIEDETEQYVGFFTDHTNTFFHPYVEAIYDEYIEDDRNQVSLGKKSKLYLYVSDDGVPTNLDGMPSLSIDGCDVDVEQITKGVYCGEFNALEIGLEEDSIYNDKWSKIALNGVRNEDVELEFNTCKKASRLSIGEARKNEGIIVPFVYGINDDEKLTRQEVREVNIEFRKKFSNELILSVKNAQFRIYVHDGNREYDVIPYHNIERRENCGYFIIHTEDLIPHEYFVDIKLELSHSVLQFKKALRFSVVSNVTERYQ